MRPDLFQTCFCLLCLLIQQQIHTIVFAVTLHIPPLPAGHNYIGTEHILLGLLRENEGVASRVLETLGADLQKIRTQVTALPAVLLLYMHVCHRALPAVLALSLCGGPAVCACQPAARWLMPAGGG